MRHIGMAMPLRCPPPDSTSFASSSSSDAPLNSVQVPGGTLPLSQASSRPLRPWKNNTAS